MTKAIITRETDEFYRVHLGKAYAGKYTMAEDGSFTFQQSMDYGRFTADGLRAIADELDRLNQEEFEKILRQERLSKKRSKIELLNSEGPVLTAQRLGDRYLLHFTQDSYMLEVSHRELCEFLAGLRSFSTPEGRVFDYREFSGDMKPEFRILYNFIRE